MLADDQGPRLDGHHGNGRVSTDAHVFGLVVLGVSLAVGQVSPPGYAIVSVQTFAAVGAVMGSVPVFQWKHVGPSL